MGVIGAYLRVSTHDQDCDSQRHAITEWLKGRSETEVRWFQDDGISGALDARPAFQDLLAAVERKEIDTVVVFRLDRLSRRAVMAMQLLLTWIQQGVAFYAVNQPILHLGQENPMRLTIAAMMSEIGEMERQTIVSRVRSGLAAARARGQRLGPEFKLSASQQQLAREMRAAGISCRLVGERFGVSAATIWRLKERA